MNRLVPLLVIIVSLSGSIAVQPAIAASYETRNLDYYWESIKENTRLGGYDDVAASGPMVTAALIVNRLLLLLGIIVVCLMVYAGFLWMMARGNEDDIKKAKDILTGSAIGLFVILASYSIMAYIFRSFVNITN